ncbi:uncharacterized protein Pyn_22961 [Prunus yedoensis var. nudiflora]|uniref:Uncharacterized protein n=1 Tax=Prunus yedoensis var. nudiflora TaxID=2094558 RepID=A0A314UQY3_PRUYE|nr:uncharacterized protein Pyn_22961 [Prunus yedoensis var. nudiflora]
MTGVFRRSLSFPNKINPNNRQAKVRAPMFSHHTRSISLPTRSHPLISQLKDHIAHLQTWATASFFFSDWLCQGLTRLRDLHHCLDDTLRLPQTQDSLRRLRSHSTSCCWLDNLLDQFLRFVDVYGIFRTSVFALKQDHSAAQVALRKRDDSQIALYVKARKRMAKEMIKLVNAVRCIVGRPGPAAAPLEHVGDSNYYSTSNIVDHELAGVMSEVVQVTVTVSLALFNGIAAALSSGGPTTSSSKSNVLSSRWSWMGILFSTGLMRCKEAFEDGEDHSSIIDKVAQVNNIGADSLRNLRKKGEEEVKITLKKMQELEVSISAIETCSETVFRSLINARVSLLNTLTLL